MDLLSPWSKSTKTSEDQRRCRSSSRVNISTGAFEEHSKKLQRLLRQPEFCAIPAELAGFGIQLKEAKANHVLRRRNRHFVPSLYQREMSLAPATKPCIAFHEPARPGITKPK